MNKNFDRNIEQLMNEHEVTPPFGTWNRIAAELEATTATTPVSAPSSAAIPQRSFTGLMAGVLLIGASLIAAYLVNTSTKVAKPEAVGATVNSNNTTPEITKALPVIAEQNLQVAATAKTTIAPVKAARASKKISVAKANTTNVNPTVALPAHAEIFIPTAHITTVSSPLAERYYFPAIDMAQAEVQQTKSSTTDITEEASVKPKVVKADDDDDREILSNRDAPRIKFRPKKHRSFSYGKIIRRK